MFELKQVMRQADEEMVGHLQNIRKGNNGLAAALAFFERHCGRPLPEIHGVRPTSLFSTREEVHAVNREELEKLPDEFESFTFTAEDSVEPFEWIMAPRGGRQPSAGYLRRVKERLRGSDFFQKGIIQREVLLKEGAQVRGRVIT
jgi:hypothetical protein